jgi:RNA polymerase sigma-70 factor (ECF subfamily)
MTNGRRAGRQPISIAADGESVEAALQRALGEEPGRILSVLIRALGDFDLAEDALQDAVATALERWPADGVPQNPSGWLVTTARRSAIDRLRRSSTWQRKEAELRLIQELEAAATDPDVSGMSFGDERLRLIFTCCHPALPLDLRVALTLRTVGGLTTAEVARAFLVPETTMKQRLVRAKRRIHEAAIPYSVPSDELLTPRLGGVLAVLYLIFNEGYTPTSGEAIVRPDLSSEAIRLARLVAERLPHAEPLGLLALMLFHDGRREARTASADSPVLLKDQDRSLWDKERIAEAYALLRTAAARDQPGPYQLQAAIAALHTNARTAADTDWSSIAALYDSLVESVPTPVIALNRAVAHGMAHGPGVGLEFVDGIKGLERYHLFHATRADLLRRLERYAEASAAYGRALQYVSNGRDREYLLRRLDECGRKQRP